jgi:phosphoserine phosphatase RsbU/P
MHLSRVSDSLFARYSGVREQPGYLERDPSYQFQDFEPFLPDTLLFGDSAKLPSHPRLSFGQYHRSARPTGADYYDVLSLGSNRFAIVMGNVSGPNAPAAAAAVRNVAQTHADSREDSATLLHHINEYFHHLRNDAIVATGLCAVVDTRRRTVRLACAGHPVPLLVRAGAGVAPIPVHAMMPLGKIAVVVASEYELRSGDRLLFYTDGITDRENADGVKYDVGRLTSALQETQEFPASLAVDCIANEVERFAGGHEPDDDRTLLLMQLN